MKDGARSEAVRSGLKRPEAGRSGQKRAANIVIVVTGVLQIRTREDHVG